MAPVIRSRYEQYKRDTQQFTTWLAQTAISLGYPLSKFDQEVKEAEGDGVNVEVDNKTAAKSKKNAKRNARARDKAKLARESLVEKQGNGSPGAPSDPKQHTVTPTSTGRYTLKLSLYTEVAQYIVDKGAIIPIEVIRILRRCIILRLKTSRQFVETEILCNESHRYFVDILIKVRDTLESIASFNNDVNPNNAMDPIAVHNKYSELSSDDSEDDAEDVPDIDLPRVSSSIPYSTFEPELLKLEAIHAIVMFLGDMERVRLYIEALWKDYKLGDVDLITAAVTTNTAIDLLQRPHDELMQRVMPLFNNDFEKMTVFTFALLRGYTTGQIDVEIEYHQLIDERDINMGRIYDYMMLPFIQTFVGLSEAEPRKMPIFVSGSTGIYDPNAAFSQRPFRLRWQQYQILLPELFCDVLHLLGHSTGTQQDCHVWYVDAIVRVMDHFIRTREISFQLTFAMRVFVDINFILGSEASRGGQYLHDAAGQVIEVLEQRPSVEGTALYTVWPEQNETVVKHLLSNATWCFNLDLRKNKSRPGFEKADWLMVERHPLLCGLMVLQLQMAYSEVGLALANAFTSIQSAAHLYQACRHSGQMQEWIDMDFVLELHGREEAFGGMVPTNIDDSNRAFQLVSGFANRFIDGKRVTVHGPACTCVNKCGLKGFQNQSNILSICRARINDFNRTQIQDDMSAIEALLRDLKAGEAKDLQTSNRGKSRRRGYRKERKHSGAKYSITQLLSVLEKGLLMETTSIRFDYLSLHLRCLRIFRDIKQVSDEYLVKEVGADYIENNAQLSTLTGWIFRIETFEMEQAMGIKPDDGKPRSHLLSGAREVFRRILGNGNEGRKETLALEKHRKS